MSLHWQWILYHWAAREALKISSKMPHHNFLPYALLPASSYIPPAFPRLPLTQILENGEMCSYTGTTQKKTDQISSSILEKGAKLLN